MPYNDDTDRFCPVCHGARVFYDPSPYSYTPGSYVAIACEACRVPEEPAPIPRKDDLIDAAIAKLAAAAGMTPREWRAREYADFHGSEA